MHVKPRAVVLVSGGLDSATVLAIARAEGYESYALSFRYGQRHEVELAAAARVAAALGAARHEVVDIDLRMFGGSALTDDGIAVPHQTGPARAPAPAAAAPAAAEIPVTYVPARNTIFLSFGLAWAEVLGANDLFFGASSVDYSGYPDCRPEYVAAYEQLANLATKATVTAGRPFRVRAPLMHLTKAETIRRGLELGVDYGLTHSCYDPGPAAAPCGSCDSCLLRERGFAAAGVPDPALAGQRA